MNLTLWQKSMVRMIGCVALLFAFQVADAATRPGRAAVCAVKGTAEYQIRGELTWQQLKVGMVLAEGVSIRTGKGSSADLAFTTGAIARITEKTSVSIDKLTEETNGVPQSNRRPVGNTELTLQRGKVMTEVAKQTLGSKFRVHTPAGNIDVKGTQLIITYDPTTGQFTLSVPEGSVTLTLPNGQLVTVTQGNQITGTYYPATGQVVLTQPVPTPIDPAFREFLDDNIRSGIRELVINSTGPIDLDAVLRAAIAAAGGAYAPIVVVIPNITNPSITSPSLPASP